MEKKTIFENKSIEIQFYLKGLILGFVSDEDDIYVSVPFFVFTIKKESVPFLNEYGDILVGALMGWILLVIISHLIM